MNPEDVKIRFETITRKNDPEVMFAIRMLNTMMSQFDNSDHEHARGIVEKFRNFTNEIEQYL